MRPIEKVLKVSELELKFKRRSILLRLENGYFDDHIFSQSNEIFNLTVFGKI